MMMTGPTMADDAFRIDHDYDDQGAGRSRYLNYVKLNQDYVAECWDRDDPKADFAAAVWRVANGPVMSPPYVCWHPRIRNAELVRSDWDGKLLACVDLITPPPEALRQSSEWGGGRWWRGWPSESLIGREAYYEPGGRELRDDPYILPVVSLRWAVPMARVLTPPAERPALPELQEAARRTVADLVAEMNATVNPVITRLGNS
jgi:hypothetical protein